MDFFEHQEQARRRSGLLVVLFALSVAAIVAVVYVVASLVMTSSSSAPGAVVEPFFDPARLAIVAFAVGTVVGLGSLYKLAQLSSGGSAVAEMMGGRQLQAGTDDPLERRVLNVVEEMAIASGSPVPPVYMLDREDGINAFAAGKRAGDAVIGVTRGCVEKLSRDELQGVVAHEFSHVLNGDMRLNLRLIGVLHGILVLGLVGQYVFRSAIYAPRRSNRDGGNAVVVALAVGAALAVVGAIGTFFGQIIQAAVSRQREYLADASAVQFTRNADGIAGALKKIGGFPSEAKVGDGHAGEISHMLFGEPGVMNFGGLLATHPPLIDRIRRVDPRFDGRIDKREEPTDAEVDALREAARHELRGAASAAAPMVAAVAGAAAADPSGGKKKDKKKRRKASDAVADVDAESLAAGRRSAVLSAAAAERARELIDGLPASLRDASGEPWSARAVVLVLVLEREGAGRERQLELIGEHGDAGLADEVRRLGAELDQLDPAARLPLLQLALAPLHQLTADQYDAFVALLDRAIESDHRVELFEMVLRRIVRHHLDPIFGRGGRGVDGRRPLPLSQATARAAVVIGLLVRVGHTGAPAAGRSFAAAARALGLDLGAGIPDAHATQKEFDGALAALDRLVPSDKQRFLLGCEAAIARDGRVTQAEAELYRAIAESIDCPAPLLVAGQELPVRA